MSGSQNVTAQAAADAPAAVADPAPGSLVMARAALEDHFYETAESELRAFLAGREQIATPTDQDREAVALLLQAMAAQEKFDAILELLGSPPAWIRFAPVGSAEFWGGFAQHHQGHHAQAIKTLGDIDTVFAESPFAPQAIRLLAKCRLHLGETQNAAGLFLTFDERYPASPESARNLLDLAEVFITEKQYGMASDALVRLVDMEAEAEILHQGHYWLGRVHALQGKHRMATNALTSVALNDSASPDLRAEAWYTLGGAHLALNASDVALSCFRKGLDVADGAPVKRKGKRLIGTVMIDSKGFDEGIALLKEVVRDAPEAAEAGRIQLLIAQALAGRGESEKALLEYQHYLETFPDVTGQAEARIGKGREFTRLERYAEAAGDFMKAHSMLKDRARQAQCLFLAGRAYVANSQHSQAGEALAKLIHDHPESELIPDARFELAESLQGMGKMVDAEQAFLLLSTNTVNRRLAEEALLRIAEMKWAQGKREDAVDTFTRCLATHTNGQFVTRALIGRGTVHYELGEFKAALADFENVLITPGARNHRVRYLSGLCHYWLGNEALAVETQQAFLTEHTNSAFVSKALYWLGNHAFNAGRYEQAEAHFSRFSTDYPADENAAHALLWAGRAAYRSKEFIRAIEVLGELVKLYPDSDFLPEARFEQGNALCELAKFSEAILVFQEIVNKHPDHDLSGDAWLRLGDCQFMLGADGAERYENAMASYRAAAEGENARLDLVMHAEYKGGRCLQKLERLDEAVAQYYQKVIVPFLSERADGRVIDESSRMWFWRSAREAASILEEQGEWRKVVSILERVLGVGIPAEAIVQERIKEIKAQHWWEFY